MGWIIGHERDERLQIALAIAPVGYAFRFIAQAPVGAHVMSFTDAIWLPQCDFENSFTGIWKLALRDVSTLKPVLLLHAFSKRCSREQAAACRQMISCFYDSFDNADRFAALDQVLDGGPFGAALTR